MKRLLILPFLLITSLCFAQTPIRIMDTDGNKLTVNSDGTLPVRISGNITLDTTATVVLTASDCQGGIRINNDNDVIDYTLPDAVEGQRCLFQSMFAAVVTVDAFDTGESIVLDGTTLTAGNAIDSPGGAGDYILLIAISDTQWVSMGRSGNWIDGGAD